MPQAGMGSHMLPNILPVGSPSTVRLEPELGETTTARKGRPDDARTHSERRAGSNSYGDCRHCSRSFPLRDGRVPPHHQPTEGRGPHPLCQGSGEAPVNHIDAADGSDLLEA